MSNNIENRPNIVQNLERFRDDLKNKRTINDDKPTISVSENVKQTIDNNVSFDDLKITFEGLRDGPSFNQELHALISTIISSAVAESFPQPPLQNTSTDSRIEGGDSVVESSGPVNSQGAMRKLQQVMSSDSRKIQQLSDYLQLTSAGRKDEYLHNTGLEYKDLPPTLNSYKAKREELLEQVKLHVEGVIDKATLKHQSQQLISYIDVAMVVIDNTLKMEDARFIHQKNTR